MGDQLTRIDDYISTFPENVQPVLEQVRQTIRGVVPDATETISYQIPTFTLDGKSLVHFAGWKKHIGIYPMPEPDEAAGVDFEPYRTNKGTGQFSLAEPIPYDVIERAVSLLVEQRTAHQS